MKEPIAWLNPDPEREQICPEIGYEATICEQHPKDLGWIPLYVQREWVGLTVEEQITIASTSNKTRHWIVCETESMLKDKNT